MDTRLDYRVRQLHLKFEEEVNPWVTDATHKLRKFSKSAKLVVSGDEDNPYTYTVKYAAPNYNYKDTIDSDFWDPFVKLFGTSDSLKVVCEPRKTRFIMAKVERDCIMSHDEDPKIPGFPVTTLYDYIDGNLKVTEAELCSLSKKLGDEWKDMTKQTLNK